MPSHLIIRPAGVMAAIAAAILLAILANIVTGAPPEAASFRIDVPHRDGSISGGSATFFHPHLACTNVHVVERLGARCRLKHQHAGDWIEGTVVAADEAADIAIVMVPGSTQPFVELAESGPQADDTLLLCGYGSDRVLKRGAGRCRGQVATRAPGVAVIETSVASISGDSGGGLFDATGRLVAINWGADPATNASQATPVEHLKALGERWATSTLPAERWIEVQCFGGRCRPGGGPVFGFGNGGGATPKLPIAPSPAPPAALPPTPPGPPAAGSNCPCPPAAVQDLDALAERLVAKLAADPRFRGPAGPTGPAGPAGAPGPAGKPAEVDYQKLAAAVDYQALAAEIRVEAPAAARTVHYVVVAGDQASDRLAQQVRYAQSRFAGIARATPPSTYTGPLPVVVKYTAGVPEYVARGEYQVEQALATLAQGRSL